MPRRRLRRLDVAPECLRETASPRAQGFLTGVTETARDVQRLAPWRATAVVREA
ncbi:hypothetical protein [Streptomyces sp. NPDC088727]|uniref:hypothetical protein n=1 Tax=Streptomyces sp. NPDC088727 TaxID=3365875 RepID=UPI0037F12A5E